MIRDLQHERPDPLLRADVCIVGAGAAGIVLAVELLRQGKSVTLLEGGGAEIEEASQEPYKSEVTGTRHAGIHSGRFRAQGGTTTKWGGQILELDEQDFRKRGWVQGSGWPIEKAELAPYYVRALKAEGLGAVLHHDADVWASAGLQPPPFGGLESYFSRWCPEPNFGRLHGDTLGNAAGLNVWLHSNAVELLLRDGHAVGVRCKTLTGAEAAFHAEQYVFCLGTIESSRFFLQPREGRLPWDESGLLGKHFQDHIDSNAALVKPRSAARFHELFDNIFNKGLKYHPKLRLSAAEQERLGTLNVAAAMLFQSDSDEVLSHIRATAKHLMRGRFSEVKPADLAGLAGNLSELLRQSYRYAVQHRAYNPADATIQLRVHCEQEPQGASSISLAESRDALGMLRTRLDWQIADSELKTIAAYVDVAQKSLSGLAEIVPDPALDSRNYVARCDDSNHHMGGMRMAASASAGVVTTDLRLHGVSNAYVCSGAVFPTSGFSNPTHTLLALAVRLADHLR